MGSAREGEIATALAVLAGAWNVERIAAWAVRGQQAVPLCLRHLWRTDIELGERVWRQRSGELRAGHKINLPEADFHPLRDGNQTLLGFVQAVRLSGDVAHARMDSLAEQVLVRLGTAFAALEMDDAPALPAHAVHSWRARRAELVLSLDHHSWNFTHFALARGVTRQTVRNWTRRFKIEPPSWARRRKPPRD
jgi:hypothetical protein